MPSRTLNVVVSGDARGLNRTLDQVERQTRKTERSFVTLGKSGGIVRRGLSDIGHGAAYALGAGGFGGGMYALFDITKKTMNEFRESQQISRQTAAVLRSTGGAANVTAKGIQDLATAISRKSGIDDETIASGENMLLTFTKIRNEAGKGNRIFDQTTQAVTDMAVAMSGGAVPSAEKLRTTSILVGKALNDPIRGSTALRRVGVALTKQQQDQIKTLESTGHHLAAQKIILRELTNEFGGSAAKQRTAAKSLNVTLGNLAETIGGYLAPKVTNMSVRLNRFVQEMQDGRGEGGRFARKMQDLGEALSKVAHVLGTVAGAIASVTRWLARASANVSLFVEDVLHGTRQTGRFGAALHDVGVTLGNIGRILVRIARVNIQILVGAFNGLKDAVNKVISPVKWLIEHVPHIHLPKIPFIGDPRPGWEQSFARANTGGVPAGTLGAASALGQKFGLHITSGYRTPAQNRAVGGVEGSLHTHGTPGNPGAVDLVGSAGNMRAAEQWARQHLNLKELLVHDVGSGLHLHLGFGDPRGAEKAMARRNAVASRSGALSFGQLEALWVQAGGRREAAPIMARIALAESGGIPSRNNGDRPGDGGRTIAAGLWQILGLPFAGNAYDPLTNARMAIAKSGNGRNLHPWDSSRAAWGQFVGQGGTYTGSAGGAAPQARAPKAPRIKIPDWQNWDTKAWNILSNRGPMPKAKPVRVDQTVNNALLQAALTHYDNMAAAGQITPEAANAYKTQVLQNALNAKVPLAGEDRLIAQGMIRDLQPEQESFASVLENALNDIESQVGAGDISDREGTERKRSLIRQNLANPNLSGAEQTQFRAVLHELDRFAPVLSDALSEIDLRARAGDLTDADALAAKIALIQGNLANPDLSERERLEFRAELGDLTRAQNDTVQALKDHTAALKDNTDALNRQTNMAEAVQSTENFQLKKYLADVLSGQFGRGVVARSFTPGAGVEVAY